MRLRIALLLALCLLTGMVTVAAPGATAAAAPEGATYEEVFFPSGDGTMLHGELLLPEGRCADVVNADGSLGCPVVVSVGPYFGSGVQNGPALGFGDLSHAGVANRFFDFITYEFDTDDDGAGDANIFDMGYAWLQVDSRGFGSSGGCNDYGGHGEQMDAAAAVTWAGTQDWSNGKVGMWGKSYDGWTQVMAMAENPPHLEAVVIQAPLIERYGIGYVNGVHHALGWYVTTNLYALYDYTPPAVLNGETSPEELVHPALGSATDPCWAEQNVHVLNPDHDAAYWQEGDLRPRASRNDDVGVFWVHGFTDVNTKSDQIFGVYDGLPQGPEGTTRAWFGQWDHVRGTDVTNGAGFEAGNADEDFVVGRAGFHEEALDWLDHHLRGEEFEYAANAEKVVEVQDNRGDWRTEFTYPAPDTLWTELPLNPGSYVDDGDGDASTGYWTVSPEVEADTRIAGETRVSLDTEITIPFAQLIGVLYDLAPDGEAREIGRSAYRIEESGTIEFRTQPGDWVLEEGHRLAFHITSGHPEFVPYSTQQTVQITGGSITVPFLEHVRDINLTGGPATSVSPYDLDVSEGDIDLETAEADWDIPTPVRATPQHQVQPDPTILSAQWQRDFTPGGTR